MDAISSNLSQQILQMNQLNQLGLQSNLPLQNQQAAISPISGNFDQTLLNDIASLSKGAYDVGSLFDNTMNDIASFQDLISSTLSNLSQIKSTASDIKSIIAQAQQGGLSQNLIDQMQLDVNSKLLDISILKDAATNDKGINAYSGPVGINVPSLKSLFADSQAAGTNGETQSIDLNFDVAGVSFFGSANVTMSQAEDGSFQLAFDVTLDYDLSAISGEGGITSEEAMNVIDGLLALMGDQEGTLENASSIMDKVLEKIFETMGDAQPNSENINGYESSSYLKNQIVEQASSTLNSINMNQMPGLALGLI